MEKLLPMLLTATLAMAGLTGISQAQQEPLAGEKPIVEVDVGDDSDELDDFEQNVDNMLKLLDELQSDDGKSDEVQSEDIKVTEQKSDEMKASIPQDDSVKRVENIDPAPAPIEKKTTKNRIEPTNEVVKFVPKDPESHFKLGLDYWRSQNLDGAIQHFEEVVRLDPNNAHAYWNLGLLYEQLNMRSNALVNLKKAEAIYVKYDYSLYVAQARKRLEELSKKFDNP